MSEAEYKITKVTDFLKVPEDRLAACLEAFLDFLDTMSFVYKVEPDNGANIEISFVWHDDGKRGGSFVVEVGAGRREQVMREGAGRMR